MTEPVKITAIIVSYNEARYLPEALRRLQFADEIIQVDLGSEDNCKEIGQQAGARVYDHPLVAMGEMVHRFAIPKASHPWILFCDPDMYYPEDIGPRLKALLANYADQPLASVYVPMFTCFGGVPLMHGQKGGARGFRALIHRERVEISELLHRRGIMPLPGTFDLSLVRHAGEAIEHHWVDSIDDAYRKGRRYLPFEGESRQVNFRFTGRSFSWKGMGRELLRSLYLDLKSGVFKDRRAVQVMVFQLWYLTNANLNWRRYAAAHREQSPR